MLLSASLRWPPARTWLLQALSDGAGVFEYADENVVEATAVMVEEENGPSLKVVKGAPRLKDSKKDSKKRKRKQGQVRTKESALEDARKGANKRKKKKKTKK